MMVQLMLFPSAAILNCIEPRVIDSQNQGLLAPFVEEIREAVFSMHPDKTLGPDGFNPIFYRSFWSIVGFEGSAACLNCLNQNVALPGGNHTNTILLPKKKNVETLADLHPISLYNVIDKIIIKAMTNRFKQVLPYVISKSQSAFVPGPSITDNIMIAFEVLYLLNRKSQGKTGLVAFKTDISKAYDRVEWSFLQDLMRRIGFDLSWIDEVMQIVTLVSYHIYHEGRKYGPLLPG